MVETTLIAGEDASINPTDSALSFRETDDGYEATDATTLDAVDGTIDGNENDVEAANEADYGTMSTTSDRDLGLDQTPSFGGGAAGANDPGAPTDRAEELGLPDGYDRVAPEFDGSASSLVGSVPGDSIGAVLAVVGVVLAVATGAFALED